MPLKNNDVIRYILNPGYALRGWKLLPFGLQYYYVPMTEFFLPDKYKLLEACDGQTNIVLASLTDEEREQYRKWEQNKIIRRALPGDHLLPYQYYRYFDARFKESVQWSITGRCNYKCRHCFMSAPAAVCPRRAHSIPTF